MKVFFTTIELLLGAFGFMCGVFGPEKGMLLWGSALVLLAAHSWFVVDWKNGWDGRHDADWILRRVERRRRRDFDEDTRSTQ